MALSLLALILCYVLAVHSATFDPNYPMPGSRDPLLWPFANYSIWNLPIGTSATYVAANIKGLTVDSLLGATEENIFLDNTKPLTNIYYSSAGWNGVSRCDPTPPAKVFISGVPLPTNFIVGSPTEYYTDGIFAALMPDGETITQTQPISKCNGSTYWTSGYLKPSANIYTDGIQGLSCLGGAMRLGEFIPDANGVVRPVRHALKTLINGGTNYYKASTYATCYRWPALGCDGSFQSAYGGTNPYLQPGSLMALPPSININTLGLRSVPALALAWTLQNYGVYVVDNLGQDAVTLCTETSPNGVYADLFAAAWKYPKFTMFMGCNQNWCNNFTQDVWVLYQNLYVVTSWTEANYNQVKASNGAMGVGGGAPRQPWAPPFVGQPTPAPTTARPTPQPTVPPTGAPTKAPTMLPTVQPTPFPTPFPTAFPTSNPTPAPTNFPTAQPTPNPTNNPTPFPTVNPTPSPTNFPTSAPTFNPTLNPTLNPTNFPTANPTPFPTNNPTPAPTANPTENPTLGPTANPTPNPTPFPTNNPTPNPTPAPTSSPTTAAPTVQPTGPPTPFPTEAPSMQTLNPTPNPTPGPTPNPTPMPTPNPTPSPTAFPTAQPTPSPTAFPTAQPTPSPTAFPTPAPTSPTSAPTPVPVGTPTLAPTEATSAPTSLAPTSFPTSSPTPAPTPFPTALPTLQPTAFPTAAPILATAAPTQATNGPTPNPTPAPAPTDAQTNSPTGTAPTASPTAQGPTSATGAPIGSVILPTPPTEAVAPTTAPLGGCWNYSAMCRKFNTDIGWMLNQLNGDAVLANYPISSLGHCADSERDMTFQFIVALAPLRDNEKKTICDAISDHMDAAFEKPSRCYYMDCKAEQRKRSEQDSAAITQFSVSVGEDAPSAASQPMPFWVYIIAAVGGLLIVLALVILIMAAFMKTRKTPEWHKYGDNDRYHQI